MDPRTFLPGPRLEIAALPRVGQPAPPLPLTPVPGRPYVLAFLRHTGCPFAEATMRNMRDLAAEAPDVQWFAISHAATEATRRWCEALGGCGQVTVVSDPGRASYAAWGLGQTSVGHFLGRRSLASVSRLAAHGIRNRHPHGTRWQSAGTFAVDPAGAVRWVQIPEHAGDLPDLEQALAALGR